MFKRLEDRPTAGAYPLYNLYIHRTATCWIADMRFTPQAKDCLAAMGTCWIETAFSQYADFHAVAARLEALNPGSRIREGVTLTAADIDTARRLER